MRFRSSLQFAGCIACFSLVFGCTGGSSEKTAAEDSGHHEMKQESEHHDMGETHKHVAGAPICPVSGHDANSETAVVVSYEGKEVRLCCQDCVEPFNKEPAKYMAKLEMSEAPVTH